MRRLAALLLIATSAWLLYQVIQEFIGMSNLALDARFMRQLGNINFLVPAVGAVLGLLGGLVAFFGGVGGAALAMCGGVVAAGFFLYAGDPFWSGDWKVWKNEAAVGLAILILSGVAAIMGRR